MKVILQQDIKGQGKKGQMVDVSDGYARNYLLPRKLAIEATTGNVSQMKSQQAAQAGRLAAEKTQAERLAEQIKAVQVKVVAKAGSGGRLFGAVTTKEISEALKAQHSIDLNKSKIVQDEPIKACGEYELKCKLGHEISATLHVVVTPEK